MAIKADQHGYAKSAPNATPNFENRIYPLCARNCLKVSLAEPKLPGSSWSQIYTRQSDRLSQKKNIDRFAPPRIQKAHGVTTDYDIHDKYPQPLWLQYDQRSKRLPCIQPKPRILRPHPQNRCMASTAKRPSASRTPRQSRHIHNQRRPLGTNARKR
jgi:hypothetical protein